MNEYQSYMKHRFMRAKNDTDIRKFTKLLAVIAKHQIPTASSSINIFKREWVLNLN